MAAARRQPGHGRHLVLGVARRRPVRPAGDMPTRCLVTVAARALGVAVGWSSLEPPDWQTVELTFLPAPTHAGTASAIGAGLPRQRRAEVARVSRRSLSSLSAVVRILPPTCRRAPSSSSNLAFVDAARTRGSELHGTGISAAHAADGAPVSSYRLGDHGAGGAGALGACTWVRRCTRHDQKDAIRRRRSGSTRGWNCKRHRHDQPVLLRKPACSRAGLCLLGAAW